MRKRHVLVLAVIAVAVVLALPGVALAADSVVRIPGTIQENYHWVDLDNGASEVTDVTDFEPTPGMDMGVSFAYQMGWYMKLGWGGSSYAFAAVPYEDITWEYASGLTFDSPISDFELASVVIQTSGGNLYKVQPNIETATDGFFVVFTYSQLTPNNPPTMLADLAGYISAPTVGTISPAGAKVLGAEVILADKLLAQGHPKLAVAVLRAVIAEVKVLPTRVVSAEARAEIIAQANAIIAAINQ